MAKKVIWSLRAQTDRKDILRYWIQRNKSNYYSVRLNKLFEEAANLISVFPNVGKKTEQENIRIKIVRNYLLVYEEFENEIHILAIWSSHQDHSNLKIG